MYNIIWLEGAHPTFIYMQPVTPMFRHLDTDPVQGSWLHYNLDISITCIFWLLDLPGFKFHAMTRFKFYNTTLVYKNLLKILFVLNFSFMSQWIQICVTFLENRTSKQCHNKPSARDTLEWEQIVLVRNQFEIIVQLTRRKVHGRLQFFAFQTWLIYITDITLAKHCSLLCEKYIYTSQYTKKKPSYQILTSYRNVIWRHGHRKLANIWNVWKSMWQNDRFTCVEMLKVQNVFRTDLLWYAMKVLIPECPLKKS